MSQKKSKSPQNQLILVSASRIRYSFQYLNQRILSPHHFLTFSLRTILLAISFCSCFSNPILASSPEKEILVEESSIEKKVLFTKVEFLGNTVISTEEIQAIISEYPSPLEFSDLLKITRRLTDLYVTRGYITSGAFLPQQKSSDGVAHIKIVEGKLEKIEIKGRKNLREKLILSYFPDEDLPLNIKDLEQSLKKLESNPSIKKVNAELVKGTQPNKSVLMVEISKVSPFQSTFSVNNYRSPNIGEYQGIINISYINLIGIGDSIQGEYNLTEGFDAYSLGFSLPIKPINAIFSVERREGDSRIIRDSFREADIRAEADTISLLMRQALFVSPTREIAISFSFKREENLTFLLGSVPFSFTPGPQDGRAVTSIISFKAEWLERWSTSVLGISSQINFGLDFWDATVNDDAPDGIFTSWQGFIQWTKALNQQRNLLFVSRLEAQLTGDSLFTVEKFSIGGINTVRGYPQNRELGDNGLAGTFELYTPLFINKKNETSLHLIPFVDWGIVWDNNTNNTNSLMSLGIAFDWKFARFGRFRVDWGIPLINANDNSSNSLQESGVYFSLEFRPF